MPVTKTAKRARRSSQRKEVVNKKIKANLEIALRAAKKSKNKKTVGLAISLADRAAKKKLIHKNKAAHIKSSLSKLLAVKKSTKPNTPKSPKPSNKK